MLFSRVLITGANGLVGQALTSRLCRFPDYDVLATGLDESAKYTGGSCGYTTLDITSPSDIKHVFQDFTPTVLINCAGLTRPDLCEQDRNTCWAVNAEAVKCLAKQCLQHGTRLIQLSTDFVFDGKKTHYAENDRPHPLNYYGKSKLAAENVVRDAGLDNWALIRTALVFGTGINLSRTNIALWVIDHLLQGKSIEVVRDQWRTPTYAPDLADGIEKVIRLGKTGIFHVSGNEYMTVYDFARIVVEVLPLDERLLTATDGDGLSELARRPKRTGLVILKAETELGFKPQAIKDALYDLGLRLGMVVASSL